MLNAELEPKADCFNSQEKGDGEPGFLYYVIRITPNGQNSYGWAKGVVDNIKRSISLNLSLKNAWKSKLHSNQCAKVQMGPYRLLRRGR